MRILVTFAIVSKFAAFSRPFVAFSLSKSRILLIFLILAILAITYSVFLDTKKSSCYFCDFCEILLQLAILVEFAILAISDRACNPAHATEQMTDDESRDLPVLSRDSPVHQC